MGRSQQSRQRFGSLSPSIRNRFLYSYMPARLANNKRMGRFLQEALAIGIEKERVLEIQTIITLDCTRRLDCLKMICILRNIVGRKLEAVASRLVKLSAVNYMRRVRWSEVLVGKGEVVCDNMLQYAARHGKTCFIDMLLDEGMCGLLFRRGL